MTDNTHQDDILQRHRTVYGSANLPAFNYSTVGEHLMAGRNPLTAHDIGVLRSLGVTHLLDLREAHEWATPRFGLEALQDAERIGLQREHLPIVDMGAPTQEELSRAVEHIEGVLSQPGATAYVHCRAGMERTAAVLIAFHARKHGQSYEEALREMRRGRAILQPLPHQERAVRQWLREQGIAST
jgi:protein-tyrosine phosphatase